MQLIAIFDAQSLAEEIGLSKTEGTMAGSEWSKLEDRFQQRFLATCQIVAACSEVTIGNCRSIGEMTVPFSSYMHIPRPTVAAF